MSKSNRGGRTSAQVAQQASEVLRNPSSTKAEKAVAASALAQRRK